MNPGLLIRLMMANPVTDLPAPLSPTSPMRSPFIQGEADTVDGGQVAGTQAEFDFRSLTSSR
jgi:hypothetical protein